MKVRLTIISALMCVLASTETYAQMTWRNLSKKSDVDIKTETVTKELTSLDHVPASISSIGREEFVNSHRQNVLSLLTEQIPGFFSTQRSMIGWGIGDGAAGAWSGMWKTPSTC